MHFSDSSILAISGVIYSNSKDCANHTSVLTVSDIFLYNLIFTDAFVFIVKNIIRGIFSCFFHREGGGVHPLHHTYYIIQLSKLTKPSCFNKLVGLLIICCIHLVDSVTIEIVRVLGRFEVQTNKQTFIIWNVQ